MTFFMQQTPTVFMQQAPESLPATITAAIISLLVVFGTQLPGIIKTGRGWVDSRTMERRSTMKLTEKQMQQQLDQTDQLLKELSRRESEVARRDDLLAKNNQTMNETQRLMNEMRVQMNERDAAWQEERRMMTQTAEAKEVAFQALANRLREVEAERDRLLVENQQLKDELKRHDTGELDPRNARDTDPALKPTTPPADSAGQPPEDKL
jgi:hypothetical protein